MKKFIVLVAVLAMVFAFAPSAMADVTLHGSARFFTYSIDRDSDTTGSVYSDRDTRWNMGTLSRFGAKFTSGDVGGMWEMDARNGATDTSGLGNNRMRHLYGYWNFGGGQLLIGQTWPVDNVFTSHLNYTTNGLQFYGGLGSVSARTTQLRLTFGNFVVGLATPYTGGTSITGYNSDTDTTLPKIILRYDLKMDMFNCAFIAGWQSYDVVNATDQDISVDAYHVSIAPQVKFGQFYGNLVLSYAQNPGNYGMSMMNSMAVNSAQINAAGTDVEDFDGYGGAIALGFKANDMFTIEAGYAMTDFDGTANVAGTKWEDQGNAYYVQCKITAAPGVYIVPEIAAFDNDESYQNSNNKTKDGKTTVFGIWWCINFK